MQGLFLSKPQEFMDGEDMGSLKSKYRSNLICGLVFLAISIGVGVYAQTIYVGSLNFGAMNSRTFPTICAVVLAFLSLCLIIQSIRGMRKAPEPTKEELEAEKNERKRLLNVLAAVILVTLSILLLEPVGYLIVTPIFLFALIMLITPKCVRKPVKFAILSIVTAVVVYIVFRYAFSVQLPMGILK